MRPWILRIEKDKTNLKNADNFLYDIWNWDKYNKDYIELLEELKIAYVINEKLHEVFSERYMEIQPQLLFAFRTYIDSIYCKGSRDKDNNNYSLKLKFNMIYASEFKGWLSNSIAAHYWTFKYNSLLGFWFYLSFHMKRH